MRIHIYTQNLTSLTLVTVGVLVIWGVFLAKFKKASKIISLIGVIISVYAILNYTVIGRTSTSAHVFVFASSNQDEFWREMFMNALLYIPLGMSFSMFLGSWTIPLAFILSIVIEFWQYIMGTGLAQGTDVIMNTLGSFIGTIPYILNKHSTPHK